MILLPTGQKIVASTWRLTQLYRLGDLPDRDAFVLGFEHPRDLLPYCDLFRHHDTLDVAPAHLIPARQSSNPRPMPKGTIDEPLGVTAANWRELSGGWTPEDAAILAATFADDALEAFFADDWKWITRVQSGIRNRQQEGRSPSSAAESPEETARLQAIEARVLAACAKRPSPPQPAPLPFDWRTLPADDFGRSRLSHSAECRINIGGQFMSIAVFHQCGTYAGLLCGAPYDPERKIRQAVDTARRLFGRGETFEPLIVAPRLRTGVNDLLHWTALPPVTTVASFCDGADEVGVIWFQDDFGLPADPELIATLSAIELSPRSAASAR